jgi:hypothetical protein
LKLLKFIFLSAHEESWSSMPTTQGTLLLTLYNTFLQLLIDIEYNIDQIPGVDPKEDAYADERGFLRDLQIIDVSGLY